MPGRKARTYGDGPEGSRPSSDVTGCAEAIANLGTAAVAGLVAGARDEVTRVLETP